MVVVANLLAIPQVACPQTPANSAAFLPPSYIAAGEVASYEAGVPRLLGPVIHARPIAEAQREESASRRSEVNLSATTITQNITISDHLFAAQLSPEAAIPDGEGMRFDEVFSTLFTGINADETNLSLDIAPQYDFFLHAGAVCGTTAGEIHFQGEN
jgi:hypothetical protein